jgi:hypothetical protein
MPNVLLELNNLSPTKRRHLAILVAGTLGAVGVIWLLLIVPLRNEVAAKKSALAAAEEARRRSSHNAAMVEISRTSLAEARDKLRQFESSMAGSDVYRWALKTFADVSLWADVEILQIDPPRAVEGLILPKVPYESRLVTITGSAYYRDFGRYLAVLENSFPHLRLHLLELEPRHLGDNSFDGGEKLNFKMEIETLVRPPSSL